MRDVRIAEPVLDGIAAHARDTYPDECCGFLIAGPDPAEEGEGRTIVRAVPAANTFDGERRRRFLVSAEELREVERRLEPTDEILAGFYHSHPDHPARPSQFDQDHAWPWYTYLVTRVTADSVGETRAFELDPASSEFREVRLERRPTEAPRAAMVDG